LTNDIAFHEIHASVAYAEGAELVFSVWLPDKDNYEGRFLGVGNGGYGGSIDRVSMLYHLNSGLGFALAGGNAGHDSWVETNGTDGGTPGLYIPFLNYEERTEAWLHNAISLFTPLARAISEVAYGDQPKHAYFNGCSAGGGQAFALAEFHPDLYDGIVAGSPGNYQSHMWLSILWTFQAQQGEGALSLEVLQFIASAVLDVCDDLDGVEDGVLENPLACPFEVESLACAKDEEPTGADGTPQCLTEGQVAAARRVYHGPSTSDTDEQLFPGFSPGAETNWIIPVLVGLANGFTVPILQNLIYKDLGWDPATFNYTAEEVAYIDKIGGPLVNSIGADLSDFRSHGGKILSTMGWADPAIAPLSAVEHRERLKAGLEDGVSIDEFYRLFMVPGGGHCSSVSLPQTPEEWHVMEPLIKWVEDNVAPASVLATTPQDGSGRTRKLCPWPETAVLMGEDEDDSESYECRLVAA
jgi:pimeloyl-ACP methyl ester carboxylesterase